MPATTNLAVDAITTAARSSLGYGEALAADIPADRFAHMPHPTMNHPAFCYGHLSLYPNRVLELIGRSDAIVEKPGYQDLFKAGVACVDDAARYPGKDEIIACYAERHRAALDTLGGIDEEIFGRENPAEGRFKEMFPTLGGAINFLMNAHHMLHLGQVSAWRRAAGLPSAF